MAASTLSLSSAYKASVFSEINPVPHIFFNLKSFLRKGPPTVKVRKKCALFCAPFHIINSSHNHHKTEAATKNFLQCFSSVTMINIVKKYMWLKIHELKPWSDVLLILSHRQGINILQKIVCYRIITGGCFHSFVKFCIQSLRFFRN